MVNRFMDLASRRRCQPNQVLSDACSDLRHEEARGMKPIEHPGTVVNTSFIEPPIDVRCNRKSKFATNSFPDDALRRGDILIFGSCNGIVSVERQYIPAYLAGMRLVCYAALAAAIIEGIIFASLSLL